MTTETRNSQRSRPETALRWAGRILFVTAFVVIGDLALQPGYETPPRLFGSDKLEHAAAFALLAVLARIAWPRVSAWAVAPFLLLYGGAIELIQATPQIGRTASLADLAADGFGMLVGLGLAAVVRRMLLRR